METLIGRLLRTWTGSKGEVFVGGAADKVDGTSPKRFRASCWVLPELEKKHSKNNRPKTVVLCGGILKRIIVMGEVG
jgi:hypothetical protein